MLGPKLALAGIGVMIVFIAFTVWNEPDCLERKSWRYECTVCESGNGHYCRQYRLTTCTDSACIRWAEARFPSLVPAGHASRKARR